MPKFEVHDVGAVGIIQNTDAPPHELPPEAWTSGQNVRMRDNKVIRFSGHIAVFDPPTVAPRWAFAAPAATTVHWVYMSQAKGYTFNNGTHTDITRTSADYSTSSAARWNGNMLGGQLVITNGVDLPQLWSAVVPATNLIDLTNWPASTFCRAIRAFKFHLVAFYVTKSSTVHPHMVKWSHPAVPGAVPSSWDETDATKDAGEVDLSEVDQGVIQDARVFEDLMLIYKDTAVHSMQHVGGQSIFRFREVLSTTGILAPDCVATIPKKQGHFVATGDDIIQLTGADAESLIDRKWRRWLSNNIDSENFANSFCVANYPGREMWFCFPEGGATWPTKALIYNLISKTVSIRDLADIAYMAPGPIIEAVVDDSWASDSDDWVSDSDPWDNTLLLSSQRNILACDPVNTKLYQMDTGLDAAGTTMPSYIQRDSLPLIGRDRFGRPRVGFSHRKVVSRIWPKMSGAPVQISVGTQETLDPDEAIVWGNPCTFTPGTDKFCDPDPVPSGRLISLRIETALDTHWELSGYDVDFEVLGEL